ncbi:hypothetical protein [Gordonia iterans]
MIARVVAPFQVSIAPAARHYAPIRIKTGPITLDVPRDEAIALAAALVEAVDQLDAAKQ